MGFCFCFVQKRRLWCCILFHWGIERSLNLFALVLYGIHLRLSVTESGSNTFSAFQPLFCVIRLLEYLNVICHPSCDSIFFRWKIRSCLHAHYYRFKVDHVIVSLYSLHRTASTLSQIHNRHFSDIVPLVHPSRIPHRRRHTGEQFLIYLCISHYTNLVN